MVSVAIVYNCWVSRGGKSIDLIGFPRIDFSNPLIIIIPGQVGQVVDSQVSSLSYLLFTDGGDSKGYSGFPAQMKMVV